MASQRITVELDDETIRQLSTLGQTESVVAQLARSAAEGLRGSGRQRRDRTDESLQGERDKADDRDLHEREILDATADEILRIARERADRLVRVARTGVDDERHAGRMNTELGQGRERTSADAVLEHERSTAETILDRERGERRRHLAAVVASDRAATDMHLGGERGDVDRLIVDQREANEQMVRATIRAQELADEANAARAYIEASERELRAVAEFREMFIGILGHDLRNPLAAIVMSASLMIERNRLDRTDGDAVGRIMRSSARMSRMIAQLLDLTRARLGRGLPIEPKPIDLRDVCQNVVSEFDATVELRIEGNVTGTWDPDRLEEVLSNLVGNAVEYATPGSAVIVDARADADADAVVVEVRNQGEPIPADVLPFIFEPFRRARQTQKSATGNLGLGLYIAKQIVTSHGGTLEARSVGGTTTFAIRLPRHRSEPPSRL